MAKDANDERQNTMKLLIMHVARAFYDVRYVVVLDQLARHEVLKDDDLAARVGLNGKDLSKLTTRLLNDGLITVFRQNTSRTGETMSRITSKGYYYIDHSMFCNIVKWRIAEMRRQIDAKLRNELAQQGYRCPQCGKTFHSLDVGHLFGPGGIFCDQCGGELVDNQNEEDVAGNEDRMQRFNAQTQRIQEGLKRTEDMIMPKVDIMDWIKKHPTIVPNADGEGQKDDGLAIAGSKPGITQKQEYQVVISAGETPDAERLAREKAISTQKEMNVLPSWYTHSTVTGQVTAFGLKNKDYMNGNESAVVEERKAKLEVDHEEQKDSIKIYYANLEAEERASQAQTPMDIDPISRPSLAIPMTTGSVVRMDSIGSLNLKRKLDLEADTPNKHSRSTSYQSSPPSSISGTQETTPEAAKEELTVTVQGSVVLLSQVTEEHHELMTPDEYVRFCEIMAAVGG